MSPESDLAYYSVCLLKTLVIVMTLDVKKIKRTKIYGIFPYTPPKPENVLYKRGREDRSVLLMS